MLTLHGMLSQARCHHRRWWRTLRSHNLGLNVLRAIFKRRSACGSLIGGICETQEMLDFSAPSTNKSSPDLEMIDIQNINEAVMNACLRSDVKLSPSVIDMATLKPPT